MLDAGHGQQSSLLLGNPEAPAASLKTSQSPEFQSQ
jgi:hypothetical protein